MGYKPARSSSTWHSGRVWAQSRRDAQDGKRAQAVGDASELPPVALVAQDAGEDFGEDHQARERVPPVAHHRPHGQVPARDLTLVAESRHGAPERSEAEHARDVRENHRAHAERLPASRVPPADVRAGVFPRRRAGAAQEIANSVERVATSTQTDFRISGTCSSTRTSRRRTTTATTRCLGARCATSSARRCTAAASRIPSIAAC